MADKKQRKIAVNIPRMGANEESFVLVGINGVLTQIPRGKTVMVSPKVYEVLRRSNTAKEASEAFLSGNAYRELASM